jgi:hypothetical protein
MDVWLWRHARLVATFFFFEVWRISLTILSSDSPADPSSLLDKAFHFWDPFDFGGRARAAVFLLRACDGAIALAFSDGFLVREDLRFMTVVGVGGGDE